MESATAARGGDTVEILGIGGSEANDPADSLQRQGGTRIILVAAATSQAMTRVIGGLGMDRQFLIVGVSAEAFDRMMSGKARLRMVIQVAS